MNKKTIKLLLLIVLVTRVGFFALGAAADHLLPYAPTFAYADLKLSHYGVDRWLYSWANFDGVHYLTITEKGYLGTGLIQAFFPLYPLLASVVNTLVNNPLFSSLIVSNVAFAAFFILFFSLIKSKYSEKTAWYGVISLLVFPTSMFFFAVYGESLFMLLTIGAFWCLEKRKWWLMSFCIMAATATRLVGIFLVPAIITQLLLQNNYLPPSLHTLRNNFKKYFKAILLTAAGTLGLIIYMIYLWKTFHDPLYFWHVQSAFGGGRQEQIILLPQTTWRYLKIFMSVPLNLRLPIYVQEFAFGLVPLCIIIYFWLKERVIEHSWAIFSICSLLLPTMTGTFSSMPRYAVAAFPLYVLLGIAYNRYPKLRIGLVLSTLLLAFNTVLFIQGYWVA